VLDGVLHAGDGRQAHTGEDAGNERFAGSSTIPRCRRELLLVHQDMHLDPATPTRPKVAAGLGPAVGGRD
jgi:hypothetical protein